MWLVYVAGPYAIGDHAVNVDRAMLAGNELFRRGFVPFVPHLSHFWDAAYPKSFEDWMEIDLAILSRCDALLRLPGESVGADREVAKAKSWYMPVFDSIDELEAEWKRFSLNGLTAA